jgi:hypothetical protein
MLAKRLDIDLRPVGRRIGLELSDDRRNRRERSWPAGAAAAPAVIPP